MGAGSFISRLLAVVLVLALAQAGHAGESQRAKAAPEVPGSLKDHVEFSNGLDGTATSAAMSTYGSVVVAPFARLQQDGWRLKLSGGYARYTYDTESVIKCHTSPSLPQDQAGAFRQYCSRAGSDAEDFHLKGKQSVERYDVAVMPGYQMAFGALIVKTYAGLGHKGAGMTQLNGIWGARGALETWLTLSDELWLSADAFYSAGYSAGTDDGGPFRESGATVRLGYKALSWLTAGPEVAAFETETDKAYSTRRAGGFLRFDVNGMETTLSGGMAKGEDDCNGAYGAANVYLKF